ncbi:MAG: hypothetical protein WBN10_14050, partial [Polyangiales bacterium]
QHKRVFIGLRDGVYDEGDSSQTDSDRANGDALPSEVITEVLEHAAARLVEGSPQYEQLRPNSASGQRISRAPAAPFGHEVLSEKTLDEVILAYLARDLETGT